MVPPRLRILDVKQRAQLLPALHASRPEHVPHSVVAPDLILVGVLKPQLHVGMRFETISHQQRKHQVDVLVAEGSEVRVLGRSSTHGHRVRVRVRDELLTDLLGEEQLEILEDGGLTRELDLLARTPHVWIVYMDRLRPSPVPTPARNELGNVEPSVRALLRSEADLRPLRFRPCLPLLSRLPSTSRGDAVVLSGGSRRRRCLVSVASTRGSASLGRRFGGSTVARAETRC